ncbi:MAG: hypothetical protein JNM80_06765 [Phycisphaerae bacterium]|nr:hypothetical protein [Phycisphaerae bacterium]
MADSRHQDSAIIGREALHAIRNELTAIVGLAESIRLAAGVSATTAQDAASIRDAALRAAELLRNARAPDG